MRRSLSIRKYFRYTDGETEKSEGLPRELEEDSPSRCVAWAGRNWLGIVVLIVVVLFSIVLTLSLVAFLKPNSSNGAADNSINASPSSSNTTFIPRVPTEPIIFGSSSPPDSPPPTPPRLPQPPTPLMPINPPIDPPVIVEVPSNRPTAQNTNNAPDVTITSAPVAAPTNAPITPLPTVDVTNSAIAREYISLFSQLSPGADLTDGTTPRGRAFLWILNDFALLEARETAQTEAAASRVADGLLFIPSNILQLVQRYVLAIFYFSTISSTSDWTFCGQQQNVGGPAKCQYRNTRTGAVETSFRFLSGQSECDWFGINCNARGDVITLRLNKNNIDGTIPSEISLLSQLEIVQMFDNNLRGPIPSQFGRFTRLNEVNLRQNSLTGPIPDSLWSASLRVLDLEFNQLSGSLSTAMDRATNLEFLILTNNTLQGPFPTELGRLTKLRVMTIEFNNWMSTLPTEIGNLVLMTKFFMANSKIMGTIPTEIGRMTKMQRLSFVTNNITGPLPSQLSQMTQLEILRGSWNGLTGTLPELAPTLRSVSLHRNSLTGTIPRSYGNFFRLRSLTLFYNDLTGSVPNSLCFIPTLSTLSSDCLTTVDCVCCTSCCNNELGFCRDT